MDIYPVTVRGPIPTGSLRFARIFTANGKLYIAEGLQRGARVNKVTAYDLPEGEPSQRGRNASWGPWKWSSCGCGNSWGRHPQTTLIEMAVDAGGTS